MNYTPYVENRVNKKIRKDLEIVCEEILKITRPISIILFGGYGRGEGSILLTDNQVVVLKDYDILLVVRRKLPYFKIYEMSKNIHKRLGYKNPLDSVAMDESFGADILQFALNDLLYLKDVKIYEIKVASKLLWGEDIRVKIPLSSKELSPWSGIRFLFRKIPAMCDIFSPKYLEVPPTDKEKERLVYECGKIYLDIATLLTLVSRIYKPSYYERAETIKTIFPFQFPELKKEIPYLPERIEFFTNLKLFPSEDKYNVFDPVKLWFETRKNLGAILKWYIRAKNENWAQVFEEYNRRMKNEFMDEIASHYLAKRFKIKNKVFNQSLAKFTNLTYQRFFSLRYGMKLYRKEKVFLLSTLWEFPIFKVSTSGLMLLFSLNEDGSLNKDLFDAFLKSLSRIYPVRIKGTTDAERWKEGKYWFIKADRNFLDTFYETG